MSQLGKIFLGIALLGILASLGMGYMVAQKYTETRTSLKSESDAKAAALADSAKQKKLAQDAALAQADAESKLKDSTTKVSDLTTQLTTATAKTDEVQKALDQAKQEGAKAVSDLAAINDQLKGQSVPDIISARDKALADVASSQSEQKILTDQLQASQALAEQYKKDINAKNLGILPPGISGKVTFVNHTWNFVVLDVGLSNGVVPNGQLIVYRKNTFLGKVKVTTADSNSCVADILPDAKGDIQVGDYVLN
jgi:hypothetical protein